MSPGWKWFLPGYLFALPHTLFGLLLLVFYRPSSFRWSAGCIEVVASKIWFRPNAQTHGWMIYYSGINERESAELRVHERVHVVQGFLLGPLFPILYGLMFAWYFLRSPKDGWYPAYMKIPFEKQAYPIGHRKTGWGSTSDRPH